MPNPINLTPLFEAVIVILFALISKYAIAFIKEKGLQKWAKLGVEAAETIYKESGMGAKKFEYVSNFLLSKNCKLDINHIKVLIESAVFEMKKELS